MLDKKIHFPGRKTRLSVGFLLLLLGMAASFSIPLEVLGQAALSKTTPQKTAVPDKAAGPPLTTAIPVPEIVTRAADVTELLRDMNGRLASSQETASIAKSLRQKAGQISRQLGETKVILEGEPTLASLQAQQQLWQRTQMEIGAWLQVLTGRATLLGDELSRLSKLEETWVKTRATARAANAPSAILQQINQVLTALAAGEAPLEAQRSAVLGLQGRVAQELVHCSTLLAQIAQLQQRSMEDIATRDSPPIWNPDLWARLAASFPQQVRNTDSAWGVGISHYLRDPSLGLPIHLGLFAGLLVMFLVARRRVRSWKTEGGELSISLMVFERPFAAALLLVLSMASGPHFQTPPTVKSALDILAFAPMIRLIKPVVDPRVIPELYTLWFLFALDSIRHTLSGGPFSGQTVLAVEALAGTIVLVWSLFYGHIRRGSMPVRSLRTEALKIGTFILLLILAAGFVTAGAGYLRLSRLLVSEVIGGTTIALKWYAIVQIFIGVATFSFRVWPLSRLNLVVHHRALLERRTYRLMIWAAVVGVMARLLDYLGLLGPTLSFFQALLTTKLERGSISLSVEDILVFLLTVWAAYLLSAFIRFVLQEDVYPRIGVQRGMAYAASSLINYIILALGFIVGLGVIGVSLTHLTVVVGAFSVGIGFGLQSIVNNFVSGLILLFERPLHVGDLVEVGDLLGEVRRIGIRASTVRTMRGADIIVPNADLVTKQMTNWTLGDRLRRIDLPVGISYGTEPGEVIAILERVAKSHPDVLGTPGPKCLLTGYGDSSINFELRAWTDKIDDWTRIRSDLAVALYNAGKEARLTFPFPQREVRILNYSDTGDEVNQGRTKPVI